MDPKVQDIIDKVVLSAGKVATTATKKAGELVGAARTNLQIFDLNSEIDELFEEIGKKIYFAHIGQDTDAETIDAHLAAIDEKYEKINELKEQKAAKRNLTACPNCGMMCDKNDSFCKHCGTAL